MSINIKSQIKNFDKLMEDINKLEVGSEKALKDTVSDMRSRAPGWVDTAVRKVYNIKKKEISRGKKGDSEGHIGSVCIKGKDLETLKITYSGMRLVPNEKRFSLKPIKKKEDDSPSSKKPKKKNSRPYQVTAETKVGKRENLGNNVFIARSKYNGRDTPFQRTSSSRGSIESITTTSLPEMISDTEVSEDIGKKLNDGLRSRLKNNFKRHLGIKLE